MTSFTLDVSSANITHLSDNISFICIGCINDIFRYGKFRIVYNKNSVHPNNYGPALSLNTENRK